MANERSELRLNLRGSTTVRTLLEGGERFRAALSTSAVTRWARQSSDAAATAVEESSFADAGRWTGNAVRASWIYRWFTTEPEPDVIVIDLRETMVVGPVLGLLDWILDPVVDGWQSAESRSYVERIHDGFSARPIQLLGVVVLAAIVANLAALAFFGSLTSGAVGVRLLVASLALAGTRVTTSAGELTETRAFELLVALLEPPERPEADHERRER